MEKKEYVKPEVVCQRDIEALTGICEGGGNNSNQDKMSFDPGSTLCMNPMT
jgi:hypothetical protein